MLVLKTRFEIMMLKIRTFLPHLPLDDCRTFMKVVAVTHALLQKLLEVKEEATDDASSFMILYSVFTEPGSN